MRSRKAAPFLPPKGDGRTTISRPRSSLTFLLHLDYTFHAYGRTEGICGIIISDHQYPALVAHQLLSKVVDEFLTKHPRSSWANGDVILPFPELTDYLAKYQDPQQADSIMKIQKELDETKIVLHKTIESVLQRGEKIDDLVAKSDGLSAQSKMFYRMADPPSLLILHFTFSALLSIYLADG